MSDERTYGFNKDDADALVQSIGHGEEAFPEIRPRGVGRRAKAAVIGSTLTAPASSLAAMTSCTIYFLDVQPDNTRVLNVEEATAWNDDPEVEAAVGTYCRVERLDNRWMIYYLNCDTQAELIAEIPP